MNSEQTKQEIKDQAIQQFEDFLSSKIIFLQSYHKNGIKKLGHYQYPMDAYAKSWKTMHTKLKTRVGNSIKNEEVLRISDIINWSMPSLCTSSNDIVSFTKKTFVKKLTQDKPQQCKEIYEEFNLSKYINDKEPNQEQLLILPIFFLDQLMQNIHQMFSYFHHLILLKEKELPPNQERRIQNRKHLAQLKCEKLNLEKSIALMNKNVELIKSQDLNINRDNSVLHYNIIIHQYPEIQKGKSNKYLVKFGCRLKFIAKLKQRVKKAEERTKDRRNYILQLIDGEEKYIKNLQEYIEYIKKPIQKLQCLTSEEIMKLFSTIEQICKFHQSFHLQLETMFKTYNKYQVYGDIIKKYIPYFKLYLQYIYNAENAQKFLIHLQETNKDISDICKKYLNEKEKIASNELLQPTFRIARYQMLMQDIIKKTNPIMQDHAKMTEAQSFFKKNLTEVNDAVDRICRRNRMNQLEHEYGTEESPIFEQNRQFLAEYSLFLIKEQKLNAIGLICFNDMILIVEEATRKIYKQIKIDEKFFPRREEDNKIYRNMITIHSDGFITFTTGSEDKNFNKAEDIYHLLRKITKETGELVYVSVLGTEEIGSTSFSKHTEYIVEVKYLDLKKLLHMRFSEMKPIVHQMQVHYKNPLGITEEEALEKNWFNNHKSKTIEDRKRVIAQILQKMFNHEIVKVSPKYLLEYLGLPQNFYTIARYSYEKKFGSARLSAMTSNIEPRDSTSLSKQSSDEKQNVEEKQMIEEKQIMEASSPHLIKQLSHLSHKEQKQAFTILCGTEIKLGRDLYHDLDDNIKKLKEQSPKIDIYITTLNSEQLVLVKITDYDTVEDVCNKVSKLIGLRSNRDFRLFHQIGKKQLRVLEHEQKITKLFRFPKKPENMPIVGFFDNIANSMKKVVSPETYPTLIFKKYYYLPFEIEHSEVKKDLTRLRLIAYQIFSEIRDMKYQLTFDEYLLFLAMLIYIENNGKVELESIDPEIVHKIVPETIYKLKNYSQEEWITKVTPHFKRLSIEIEKIIDHNRQQMKTNKIKADTASKTALYFGHKHLCSQIVLNKIKTNPIFGSNIFYIQPHNSTYEKLIQKQLKMAYNMWLAVKVQSVNILTPSSKECVLELHYKDIQKIEVFSEAIIFKMDDYIGEQYRLNTYQSFEISQLVKYNKALNQILVELKTDTVLNSRVKDYKDELLNYRATLENGEGASIMSMIH